MSIIHDALKKVQQSISPVSPAAPSEETPAAPSGMAPKDSPYNIYEAPTGVETSKKTKNKILSVFASACILLITVAITIASINYIYQQFQNDIPTLKNFAKKSYYQLMHKEEPLAFETKASGDLKALGQLTINPSAGPKKTRASAPVTLNIHGIMSDGSSNLVLINDQVYQEGDEVDGAKIVKIDLNSITVINNGVEQTIPVKN